MYTEINFRTKKAMMEAIKKGDTVMVFEPGPFPGRTDGWVSIEGPHFPRPHRWYARARIEGSRIVEVSR